MDSIGEYLQSFGDRLPDAIKQEYRQVVEALQKAE